MGTTRATGRGRGFGGWLRRGAWPAMLMLALAGAASSGPAAARDTHADRGGSHRPHVAKKQRGKASYYSSKLAGRKMASGERMDPRDNVAASNTLPLGTKARVKNLRTGESAVVEVKDRGPVPPGRIIDVSPKTAEKLDLKQDGVAPVEVTPLKVPAKDEGPGKSGK